MKIMNKEYNEYMNSPEWKVKREKRLKIDGGVCQVCERKATEVHHLTYENLKHEEMNDLVSLCRQCHNKAEEIYEPRITPFPVNENTFMAILREDAANVATIVFNYLKEVRGTDFDSMLKLREPSSERGNDYWHRLRKAVVALCKKRYYMRYVEDRKDIATEAIINRTRVLYLQAIEHDVRNGIQHELHNAVTEKYVKPKTLKDVAVELGITPITLSNLRKDDGSSSGPSLRRTVLYYCGLDAAAGLLPLKGFKCLTEDDYEYLNKQAMYVNSIF